LSELSSDKALAFIEVESSVWRQWMILNHVMVQEYLVC